MSGLLVTAAEVAEDRALAEAHMIDACRITRAAAPDDPGYAEPVFNETTGQYDGPPPVVVYEGKCRIQVRSDINSNAVEAVVGDHEFTYRTATLQLTIDGTADVRPDSIAVLTACPLDPALVGAEFNIQAQNKAKTHATHRRYRIREVMK